MSMQKESKEIRGTFGRQGSAPSLSFLYALHAHLHYG